MNSLKAYLPYLSLLSVIVLFTPDNFRLFGTVAEYLLIVVMLVRPAADVFPAAKWLKKGVMLRKELGILSAVFGLTHGLGFILIAEPTFTQFFSAVYWTPTGMLFWGIIASIASIPPLVTSNVFSMKRLGKNWKKLQYLSYIFFVAVELHIALIHPNIGSIVQGAIILGTWITLLVLSAKKIKLFAVKE